MTNLSPDIVSKMRCPVSGAPLVLVSAWLYSRDEQQPLKYPLVDGVVRLMAESAVTVPREEYQQVMASAGQDACSEAR